MNFQESSSPHNPVPPTSHRHRLSPPLRDVSEFFFEQRLFDFTNKKLQTHLNQDMKAYIKNNVEAKEKVGAMLLAYEYFNAISEIKIKYDEKEFLDIFPSLKKRFFYKFKVFFVIVFFLFVLSLIYITGPSMMEYFNIESSSINPALSEKNP